MQLSENKEKKLDIGYSRLMSYYRTKWLSYVAIFLSIINAFAFPIYGLIYAKLLFVLMRFKDPTADYFGG